MPNLHGPRICVIDDDKAVRDSMRVLLDAYGFDVTVFPSAAAFFGVRCDYHCIVVDYSMTVTSGLEMLELLRMSSIATPAILMMDKDEPVLAPRIAAVSNCTPLLKPITEAALVPTVTAACTERV